MCWKCKKNTVEEKIFRSSECPICHADLHSCLNCKFYNESKHLECSESISEKICDKEKSNFCDFFSEKIWNTTSDISEKSKASKAKNDFLKLFGE